MIHHPNSRSTPSDRARRDLLFTGWPYLATYVVPGLLHAIVLPADLDPDGLLCIAREQAIANQLPTCLVLGERRVFYLDGQGLARPSTANPWMSFWVTDRLLTRGSIQSTAELGERSAALRRFVAPLGRKLFMLGDLTKGGRPATPEEQLALAGRLPGGEPTGLARCTECGELRGSCLEPSPRLPAQVLRVHCRCENDSRCARCGRPFGERKVAANFYDPDDGRVWHVPGFAAFQHATVCPHREATGFELSGPPALFPIDTEVN